MANQLWPRAKANFLDGSVDWDTDTIKVALVRGYTYNSAHQFLSDVTGAGGTTVGTDTLAGKSVDSVGACDANDASFGTVAAGAACQHIIAYKDTGSPSTSKLIFAIDTATGLPVTPNGSTITVTWDNGASKIFAIV